MIEDLFLGNIQSCNVDISHDKRLETVSKAISDKDVQLRCSMDAEAAAYLDEYVDLNARLTMLLQERAFVDGFVVATGLSADVYYQIQKSSE